MDIKDSIDLNKLSNNFDVAVIGGGIVGAGIIRDLALHGINAILIDKKDFSSQTSSKSSKMLHGGIRYLENYDFDLVFEALQEKNFWLKSTPHLCYESKFYLPIFKDSIRPLWMIKLGLFLYDALSLFTQSPHQLLNKQQTLKELPSLHNSNLKGSGIYHDAVVDDYRMTIEILVDAKKIGNDSIEILNHVSANGFEFNNDKVSINLKDMIKGDEKQIIVNDVIFATGPFSDDILSKIKALNWTNKLIPSKGSHLWLKRDSLNIDYPVVLTPNDGRVIFIIPQKDKILVGTTEKHHDGDKFDIEASPEEITYLKANIEEYFKININEDMILSSYAGIRPLVRDDSGDNRGKTARNHKIYQPRKNCFVIIGGKYTTFRVMASDIVKMVLKRKNKAYRADLSFSKLSFNPYYFPFNKERNHTDYEKLIIHNEFIRTKEDFIRRTS
ncbi:MAG: hypothetical protein CME69_09640 [Halobacteriovorax sp.]|nr:hypothetical protein [Halobacteriovorax sp.]